MTTSDLIATKPTATKPATNGHPAARPRLNLRRKNSLVAGAFYLLTFISIPTLALYAPARDLNFIVGPGPDTGVLFGGILELIVALAGIGTAVALFPVLKRQSEGRALGFVTSRVVEGSAHLCRRRVPPDARDPAPGRTWTRCVDHRPCTGRHV